MRFLLLGFAILISIFAGCNTQTGLAPVDSVIPKSSERDFGFAGTWIPRSNPDTLAGVDAYEVTITKGDVYQAVAAEASGESDDELVVEFRTHEISPEHPHAIIESELKYDGKNMHRRLAIAAVIDDHLYLWLIDGRKIADHLYDDGVAAVIEHFTFSSSVRCKPEKLLESLSNHSGEIVGVVQVFKRKPETVHETQLE